MKLEDAPYQRQVELLLTNVSDLLTSPHARDRVRAIHHLALGVRHVERQVLLDAQASGMSWADIGHVYGVTRQAVHRRFADESVIAPADFDALLEHLDDGDDDAAPRLARAAERLRQAER